MSINGMVAKRFDVDYVVVIDSSQETLETLHALYNYDEDAINYSNAYDFNMYVLDGTEFELDKDIMKAFVKDNPEHPMCKNVQALLDASDPDIDYLMYSVK